MGSDLARAVIKAQKDLAREYTQHNATIIETWKSLSQKRRRECILRGVKGGVEGILLDRNDGRLGNVRYIVPEINLKDICGADGDGGEYLLSLLETRVSKPAWAWEAFHEDAELIRDSMINHGLSHSSAKEDGYFQFGDEECYGFSFEVTQTAPRELKDNLDTKVREGKLLSQAHGYLVLERQRAFYLGLSVLIYDIVEEARKEKGADSEEGKEATGGMGGKKKKRKKKKKKTKD
ncbi:hypothetical protein DFP73DRAFT_561680 [Morchella snyderi]|nr:hypothetical protein DFP73DRAFT_561680 [Morchella snyderi]